MLLTVLLIVQSGAVGEEDKGSKQFLASPSMTMRGHFSTLASWIAQRMADASALRGEHAGVDLAHTFNTSPLWSLATTAIALLCLPMAASVLSLIQPRGGVKSFYSDRKNKRERDFGNEKKIFLMKRKLYCLILSFQ